MSDKYTTCYFVGKDNEGNPVTLVDDFLLKQINNVPRPRIGSSQLTQPYGSLFLKTIENPYDSGSANSTEPLTLAKGNNLFFVGKDGNTLRPIINNMPQVYIGNTMPYYLPGGSLFIKTTTNPEDEPMSTNSLNVEGFYYVNRNGSLRKLLFTGGAS